MGNASDRRWTNLFELVSLGLVGLLLAIALSLPAQAAAPFAAHPLQACAQRLEQQQILDFTGISRPTDSLTQIAFAQAVLRAFPGQFAAANAELGLTFDGATAADQLLSAALENRASPRQRLLKSQALAILATGSAAPAQPNAASLLQANFGDARLIPQPLRESVAAALVAGYVYRSENSNRLYPSRTATVADGVGYLCLATGGSVPAGAVVTATRPPAPRSPQQEIRGVWLTNIDSDVLFSRQRLEPALRTLAELNFNTVYPTVWNWGYTLFPSRVAERATGHQQGLYPDLDDTGQRNEALEVAQGNRDMLQELIATAHPLNLRVMPWFEFGFMAPADSELVRRHPDWLTQKRNGSLVAAEGRHPRVWLNPFHPQVQRFILDLVSELAANYDIDGFQVDDHMGLPYEYGYDPYTVALYRRTHNGQSPPADAKDPEWTRWRADQITNFMGEVFRTVKARRPRAVLSVSPNPHEFAYEYYLQDWATWVDRGYVEELVIQLYRSDLGRFVWEMNRGPAVRSRQHIPTAIGILTGLRDRPVPSERIAQQVSAVRDRGYAGVSFFFYETLWSSDTETLAQRRAAFQQLFPTAAAPPSVETGWRSRLR